VSLIRRHPRRLRIEACVCGDYLKRRQAKSAFANVVDVYPDKESQNFGIEPMRTWRPSKRAAQVFALIGKLATGPKMSCLQTVVARRPMRRAKYPIERLLKLRPPQYLERFPLISAECCRPAYRDQVKVGAPSKNPHAKQACLSFGAVIAVWKMPHRLASAYKRFLYRGTLRGFNDTELRDVRCLGMSNSGL